MAAAPELPTGVVTFLLSDVEVSTRQGDDARAAALLELASAATSRSIARRDAGPSERSR